MLFPYGNGFWRARLMKTSTNKQHERRLFRDSKTFLKDLWWFIWEDNSILSWLVNLVLAFILVKFIIYPGLGLLLGTSFPVVAVVSGSMEHDGSFDSFWGQQQGIYAEYGISKEEFKNFRFDSGFDKGDLMVLYSADNVKLGDIIVFKGDASAPLIHRVIRIEKGAFTTKGDHNLGSRSDEVNITKERIYGKAVLRLPYLGWFKIGFVWFLSLFRINLS